jgi:alpha-L-rhamnosidase
MQENPVTWSARWIASSVIGGARLSAPTPYFRTTFRVEAPIRSAVLHITALGLYECEINGGVVGNHVFAPGWTDYSNRVYFQSHDVTALLAAGENAIGAILGDGWYAGHVAEKDRGFYGERPQLLVQLEITAQDGSVSRIVSDSSWKTMVGPILESDLLMGETYDARRELGAWSTATYDDSAWLPVVLAADPGIAIERSPGPPVRRQEILSIAPDLLKKVEKGWFENIADSSRGIFDFKQNFTGRVRVTVRGKRGIRLILRFAEVLNKDGTLYLENLRGARATDSYTLKGGDSETYEPRFTFHGFRYVEIRWQGAPEDVVIEKVEGVVLHSEMARTGTFRCSHELLNQLESNIVWGQKGNFLEVPTDCPQRDERLGWTGDAQVFVRTAAFHMDVRGFFHKWLKDMRDAQSAEGAIPPVIPNTGSFGGNADGGPAWADAVFICPWTIYRCYNDVEILRDNYDSMARYMDYLAAHKVKAHIRAHPDVDSWGGFGDWLALDGSGRTEGGTAKDLLGTAHYANNARIMAETAELLGKSADAKKYRVLHSEIAEAFRNRYITPDGLMAGGTQTAYVLALHFDLVPPAARATCARELVRSIERNGMHLATGFVGTPYLLHVLEAHGHLDVAYKLLEQETFPSWLFPVKNGATTIWERWDGWTAEKGFQDKGMNSFNHYAYGAVGDWMVSSVAGLELAGAGYEKILFKPRPGGTITWAEAKLATALGEIAIRWELSGGTLHLKLTVPPGAEATLSLPPGWTANVPTLTAGTHEIVAQSTELK